MVSYFFYYISTCTVHITKIDRSIVNKRGWFCSTNLVGQKICWVNQLLVSTSRNSFSSLFLSKFSRLIFKSRVNVTFLFSLKSVLRVCFKYHKNSASFCFGCLYTTPATSFPCLSALFQSTMPHILFENSSISWRVLALQGRIQRLFGHSSFYWQSDKMWGRRHSHTPKEQQH